MVEVRRITDLIPEPRREFEYDIIRQWPLRLCVDVGAAAGYYTVHMRKAGSPDTRIVAFEPFEGNHPHFREAVGDLSHVELVPKAVSDRIGRTDFVVASTVQGHEPGWESMVGYSSAGRFASLERRSGWRQRARSWLRRLAGRGSRAAPELRFVVETTTLDEEFGGETIDFLKIDVQGAEEAVLRGASSLLADRRIHVASIEWAGEDVIVELLADAGYLVYDTLYIATSKDGPVSDFEELGLSRIREVPLSTGRPAYEMVLHAPTTPSEVFRAARSRRVGYIQTDLLAVSSNVHDRFVEAARTVAAAC